MLKLSTASQEPFWLDLIPGVRVRVRPITVASMLVAREAVGRVYRDEDQTDVATRAGMALVHELARRGIVEWEGVGTADGEPAPVTAETINALLDHWPAYDALDALYVTPALRRDEEKNGSSNSPDGTSAEDPNTARPAA
ncbi:hypothetical protein LNAOJCKE_4552 [Methylorubrum aminovorans]|uniref:Uncharacterized protein n=1 Tax=Methylorubrum aminovorans TaxID=269069 RepID=A0ABQ4UJ20_9HYPH|nr:hypothetical protein [Methylorubrum aminovorans]GJE67321.1 hypothetical protein LNAOJCKE_4552 [Methylorubrum aminovorans]